MFSYHHLVDGAANGRLDSITMKVLIDPGSGQLITKAQMDADWLAQRVTKLDAMSMPLWRELNKANRRQAHQAAGVAIQTMMTRPRIPMISMASSTRTIRCLWKRIRSGRLLIATIWRRSIKRKAERGQSTSRFHSHCGLKSQSQL